MLDADNMCTITDCNTLWVDALREAFSPKTGTHAVGETGVAVSMTPLLRQQRLRDLTILLSHPLYQMTFHFALYTMAHTQHEATKRKRHLKEASPRVSGWERFQRP